MNRGLPVTGPEAGACSRIVRSAGDWLDRYGGRARLAAMKIVRDRIPQVELEAIAKGQFGDLVKAVVDVERGVMAIGGELHSDEEALLLEEGSEQRHFWGINLYPGIAGEGWVEFDSMINIRPSRGNRSRGIDDVEMRKVIVAIVNRLVAR
jgi:hypothetical protein